MIRKTRKKRITGGDPTTLFIDYATKIKNKEKFDIPTFKRFLDSVNNPLKQAFGVEKLTINEYALIYNADMEIHAVFRNYEVAVNHKVSYTFASSMQIGELTILEAYILHGAHIENIRVIIEQHEQTQSLTDAILFRYLPNMDNLPTLLACSLYSSHYVNSQIHNTIYPMILNIYMKNNNFRKLTNNFNTTSVIELFRSAVKFAKPDFMLSIYHKFSSPRDAYRVIFNQSILERLMLQDNDILFLTAIDMLQYSNSEFIEMIIKEFRFQDASLFDYLKQCKITMSPKIAKQFFGRVAEEIIDNIIMPYNGSNVRIIIRSHGVSNGPDEITIDFPFHKLCYFVEKGKTLGEQCMISRRTEELICAGNFDPNLVCTESSNGKITVEDHLISFNPNGEYDTEQKQILGIYICQNNRVTNANITLDPMHYYSQVEMVEICKNICIRDNIEYSKVEVLVFACRGYMQNPLDIQVVKPVVTKLI